ncbi:MAG: CPBP family intramembrane glutamic endopeptidase [Bacteroidota bacterium]
MNSKHKKIILLSPFITIIVNFLAAYLFGNLIGKWAFIPMILIGWGLWLFYVLKYSENNFIRKWLTKPQGSFGWGILALSVGLLPLPLFIFHRDTLSEWYVWLPWIILALINPWIEEFYWRGLLLNYLRDWKRWQSVLFTAIVFAVNHAAFGVNSQLNSGFEVVSSTFIMGVVWAIVYYKTQSLRWVIFSHFLVDFLSLSAPAFLDLFEKNGF